MRNKKGFTLVEILIVVVILGILAAIVIPQFTDASTQSKVSSLQSSLQTMRSQIQLYKIQHTNDAPPTLAAFEAQMTTYSDTAGTTAAAKDASASPPIIFGPYLQTVPVNPFTSGNTVGGATTDDWVYDATEGQITPGYGGATAISVDINGVSTDIAGL